ncbi:MAG: hypothetical protein V7L27_02910 [Nostoc sp.]|uniref:hypothetical protein n=1 Tax=Nostoc sp. TaxID=1180 RepID=UPI002FFA41F8
MLQIILVCDNDDIGGSTNYNSRIFSGTKADSLVVTITVSASNRKITDTTKSSLTAVDLPKVNYVAINLQSFSVFWIFFIF